MTGPGGVRVMVNGKPRELPEGATVATVVEAVVAARSGGSAVPAGAGGAGGAGRAGGSGPSGVAVAVNDAVVPRGAWAQTRLDDDDRVEVLTAVQGG